MPSVGSLLIALRADYSELRAELDKAKTRLSQFESDTKKMSSTTAGSLDRMLGEGRLGAAKLAGGLMLVSSSMKTFGGDSVKTETKVLEGVAKMAMGYAAGGPVGAGIVGITELLGLLAAEQEKATKAMQEWAEAGARANDAITKGMLEDLDAISKRVDALRASGISPLQKAMEELAKARETLARKSAIEDAAGNRLGSLTSADQIDSASADQGNNLRIAFQEIERLRTLLPLLDGQVRRAAVSATLEDLKAEAGVLGQIEAMESELAGERSDISTLTRKIVEMERERAILGRDTTEEGKKQAADLDKQIALQRQLLTATKSYNAERATRDVRGELDRLRSIDGGEGAAMRKQLEEWTRDGVSSGLLDAFKAAKAMRPTIDFALELGRDIRSATSDALYDGLVNGFRNASEIGRSLLQTMLKKVTDSLVGDLFGALSGGGGLLAGLLGGGGGGGGLSGGASSLVSAIGGGAVGACPG